jgi:hypothetical protein
VKVDIVGPFLDFGKRVAVSPPASLGDDQITICVT